MYYFVSWIADRQEKIWTKRHRETNRHRQTEKEKNRDRDTEREREIEKRERERERIKTFNVNWSFSMSCICHWHSLYKCSCLTFIWHSVGKVKCFMDSNVYLSKESQEANDTDSNHQQGPHHHLILLFCRTGNGECLKWRFIN